MTMFDCSTYGWSFSGWNYGWKHLITGVLFQRCLLGFGVDRGVCSAGGDVVEETPVAMHGVATLAQYKLYSYMSICDFGVPCDCSLESTASGQCGEERLFLDFEQLQTHHFRQFLVTFKRCRVTNIRVIWRNRNLYFLPKELCKKVGNCTFPHSEDTDFDRASGLCCSYAVLLRIPLSGLRRDLRPFLWLGIVMCGSGTRQVTRFLLFHGDSSSITLMHYGR